MKRKLLVVLLLLSVGIFAGVGAATALFTFTDTQYVSYGDIDYESGELQVTDYETSGNGMSVTAVDVTVNNTNVDTARDGTVEVYLMDGNTAVAEGEVTESWSGGQEQTVIVDVARTNKNQFDSIEIVITEDR